MRFGVEYEPVTHSCSVLIVIWKTLIKDMITTSFDAFQFDRFMKGKCWRVLGFLQVIHEFCG